MEKWLTDTYNHMTMPEDCTRKIEVRLQTELENRRSGHYTKVISPAEPRRRRWMAAACILTAVLGVTAWRIWMTRPVAGIPESLKTEETASTQTQPEQEDALPATATVEQRVPEAFEEILSGESRIWGDMTVEEYCTALWGEAMSVNAFTLADMDDDGVRELVFSVVDADGGTGGYMVLRQEETVQAYTLRGRDLRKDGTFFSYTAKSDARLQFENMQARHVAATDFSRQDKPLAQWHTYPCQYPELVMETYQYASETGFSTHPGVVLYSYFGTLLSGSADWISVEPWLEQQSVYVEENGTFYAFDPDAPGCLMYGTLIGAGEQKKLTALGYYICDETGEYRAEAFDLDTPNPVYTVDPPPGDRGREVGSAEAMQDYFGVDYYGSDVNRDVQQIAELLDRFVSRYSEHDTEAMREYMAEDAWELSSYPFTGEIAILSYGILPDRAVAVGESWHTSVELLESGEIKTTYHLAVALVKESDGWKIHSYSIERQ